MPRVTVLQLDTDFPRVAGDVGAVQTYAVAPQIIRIGGAGVAQIVSARPDLIDITPFETALAQARGDVVVTSCGFLSFWQAHLAALTQRPFISSALTALNWLSKDVAPADLMTLTYDAACLTPAHFGTYRAYAGTTVGLTPKMHLRAVIGDNLPDMDQARAQADLTRLVAQHQTPAHRHLLLECTNLPPYAAALRQSTGLPVTDILTCIERVAPGAIAPRFLP